MKRYLTKILLTAFVLFAFSATAQSKKFKVVLDAGHGGGDTGTTHLGYKEKDIVLSTVLKVGKILENEPGFDITYTRKTDVFIELRERAHIANREDADLFVSIHCNGVNNGAAYGTETFVMGLSRNKLNLEVARKENSVITLEKDYKQKYKGFDPNSPETTIGLALEQEYSLNQSIMLASNIKNGFEKLDKNDRGIKQIPLWVLDATVMPGVLIELGFISNKTEGAYLNSDDGQDEMARTIANAIIKYKKQNEGNDTDIAPAEKPRTAKPDTTTVVKKKPENTREADKPAAKGVVYKVQIEAGNRDLATRASNFKGLKNISKVKEGRLIKYFYGETGNYSETPALLSEAKAKGYGSAYVVPFKGGKIISMKEALE